MGSEDHGIYNSGIGGYAILSGMDGFYIWIICSFGEEANDIIVGLIRKMDHVVFLRNRTAATTDAAVNHPDSYDALAWEAPGARISLSLKDKGGEGRTLIFLRAALIR